VSNYYELLKVQPTASPAEIQAAIEQQYNQWRRLVTNHDSGTVRQAEGALALLEQMRRILLDPAARAGYDAAIGIAAQQTSGLTDPEALLRLPAAIPPSIPASPASSVTMQRASAQPADAWICPQCQTINPLKTRFCSKCGQQLGIDCPNCGKLTKAGAEFCSECGRNLAEATIEANERAAVSQWLRQMQSAAKTLKYAPMFRAMVAEGSFQEIYSICVDAMAEFSIPQFLDRLIPQNVNDAIAKSPLRYINKPLTFRNLTTEPNSGQIGGEIPLSLSRTKYALNLTVQNAPLRTRGIALVVTMNTFVINIGDNLKWIADPFVQFLLNRSDRFTAAKM